MGEKREHEQRKATSGSVKRSAPPEKGGSQSRKAQEWGGGSKGSKGATIEKERHNPNASQKT